jgi:signal transduction histidine kinase
MPPDRVIEEEGILSRLRRGERIDHFETVRRRKDGTLFDVALTISPLKDARGRIIGASKIARDITDRRRSEAALKQAHDLLEQRVEERTAALTDALSQMEAFSYAVSHDLRAPLRAIIGYAEMLRDDHAAGLSPEANQMLEKILKVGDRMGALITDVLAFSRVNQERVDLAPVSLRDAIDDIVRHSPELQPPHCDLRIVGELPAIIANATFLTHVLTNLLGNAAKFVAPGTRPRIEISAQREAGNVRLAIADNGIGIKPEYQSRLFGLFERLGADQRFAGTGIGLAIVRRAVQRMGGSVTASSDGKTGSTFVVTLPAAE